MATELNVGPREAVEIAKKYAREVVDQSQLVNLRLEEVELSGAMWRVTLSWLDSDRPGGALASALNVRVPRQYKIFEINQSSGKVRSMKIRKLNDE